MLMGITLDLSTLGTLYTLKMREKKEERIYTLKVGGEVYSLSYPAVVENGKNYFSVFEFFKAIGFTNYEIKKGKLTFSLGQDGEKKVIDFGD